MLKDKKTPEIRFKGFTEDWEQRKFGEMADYKKGPFGSALKKEIFVPKSKDSVKVYEQQNAINKDWKLERYFITKEYANKLRNFETHSGDIIISCAGTIGEIYELPLFSEPGIINQALMRVRVDEKQINKDMYKIVFSNMIDDFSKEHSNGSAMKNIPPFADLKPMEVLIPKSSEQKEITDLFNNLDNLITLHQRNYIFNYLMMLMLSLFYQYLYFLILELYVDMFFALLAYLHAPVCELHLQWKLQHIEVLMHVYASNHELKLLIYLHCYNVFLKYH